MLIEKSSRAQFSGDYDNDGDLDILVMNIGDTPDLLRNDTPPVHHWLNIKLVGSFNSKFSVDKLHRKGSNRDGLGAKVMLQIR